MRSLERKTLWGYVCGWVERLLRWVSYAFLGYVLRGIWTCDGGCRLGLENVKTRGDQRRAKGWSVRRASEGPHAQNAQRPGRSWQLLPGVEDKATQKLPRVKRRGQQGLDPGQLALISGPTQVATLQLTRHQSFRAA